MELCKHAHMHVQTHTNVMQQVITCQGVGVYELLDSTSDQVGPLFNARAFLTTDHNVKIIFKWSDSVLCVWQKVSNICLFVISIWKAIYWGLHPKEQNYVWLKPAHIVYHMYRWAEIINDLIGS